MKNKLSQLQKLADLKCRQSELKLLGVQQRETKLRAEMSRLQSLARETHNQSPSDAELRAIGGDIIWLRWIAKNQRHLSIELAQVLAQKEHLMKDHRREVGKKSVSDVLHKRSIATSRAEKAKTRLDAAIQTAQTRRHFPD